MKSKMITYLCISVIALTACKTNEQTASPAPDRPTITQTEQTEPTEVNASTTPDPTITDMPELIHTLVATPVDILPGYKPQTWEIYSIAEIGLSPPVSKFPNLVIYDIEEDQSGSMWFATSFGLISFDGHEWKLEEKDTSKNYVRSAYVEISTEDEIWFTLSDGVYSLREEVVQKRMNYVDFGVDKYDVTGFSLSPNGQVWIALRKSIWFFDGDDWNTPESTNELPFRLMGPLVIDQDRILYTWGDVAKTEFGEAASRGTAYGGLSYYDGSHWVYYDQKEQYGIPAADETGFSGNPLILDGQNHIWFYLWREGLFEFAERKFILHIPYDIDFYQPISMVFDQQGTLWLGDWYEGMQLIKYVPGSDGFQSIDDSFTFYIYDEDDENQEYPISRNDIEQILPFEYVSALYVDPDNDLWIATELGVYVYDIDN